MQINARKLLSLIIIYTQFVVHIREHANRQNIQTTEVLPAT